MSGMALASLHRSNGSCVPWMHSVQCELPEPVCCMSRCSQHRPGLALCVLHGLAWVVTFQRPFVGQSLSTCFCGQDPGQAGDNKLGRPGTDTMHCQNQDRDVSSGRALTVAWELLMLARAAHNTALGSYCEYQYMQHSRAHISVITSALSCKYSCALSTLSVTLWAADQQPSKYPETAVGMTTASPTSDQMQQITL